MPNNPLGFSFQMVFKLRGAALSPRAGAGLWCPLQGVTATYDFHFIILQVMKSWKAVREGDTCPGNAILPPQPSPWTLLQEKP